MFLAPPSPQLHQTTYIDATSQATQAQQAHTRAHQFPVSPPVTVSPPQDQSQRRNPSPHASYQMDSRGNEYSQPDPASAAQYPAQQEVRPSTYSTSATPTSEYSTYPSSARSSNFPEHIQQRPTAYAPAGTHAGGTGDHSIPAPSPTYTAGAQYPSPYGAPQEMSHPYSHPGSIYAQPRPDWSNYSQPSPLTPGHPVYHPPASAPARTHGQQVYSFVPIPGATQHKRPRRRYEEIERMYKCGWNGCEKAYGTLNHLNAHVTMQSHGQKRTPEEFKEIRKEWKARKKEEEAQRKAEEERQRQAQQAAQAAQNGNADAQATTDPTQPPTSTYNPRSLILPPIGYSPTTYSPAPPQTGVPQQPLPDSYNASQIYPSSYGGQTSPYGQQQAQNMYSQQTNAAQQSNS